MGWGGQGKFGGRLFTGLEVELLCGGCAGDFATSCICSGTWSVVDNEHFAIS